METLYRVRVSRGHRAEYVTAASFGADGRAESVQLANCLGGGHGYSREKAEALRSYLQGASGTVSLDPV